MKNKKISTLLFSGLAAFTAIAAISSSIAWFIPAFKLKSSDNEITGVSEGAYYEDGDGLTEATAFIISKPRHLYNLAWLQYLGYYNDAEGTQYYFKLKNDIDMTGWNLPPIGTEENPFISNFNGQGHTVYNLTTSNTFSDFTTMHPSKVNNTYFNNHIPNIVGFFGVVGDYNDMYTEDGDNKPGVTYDSSINEMKNTGIQSSVVKSASANTLVGIAAGYVNATVSNVAVNNSDLYTIQGASAITSITSNVSDYSLIGYCTDEYIDSINLRTDDADIPTLDNPNTVSGGDNWGGSINMLDMYTYLRGLADAAPAITFDSAQTVTIDEDGNESDPVVTATTANGAYSSGFREYYRYHGTKYVEDDEEYASFTFARSSDYQNFRSYNDSDTKYICLYGGVNKRATTAGNQTTTNANITTTTNQTLFRISNGTSNYLSYRGSISNQTTTGNASGWRWEDGSYLCCTYNSTKYYLTYNNGNLAGSTTRSTQWTYSSADKNIYTTVNGTNYYLDLSGTTWRLVSTDSTYYLIKSGNNYMTHTYPVTTYANVTNTASNTEPTDMTVRWYYVSGSSKFSATESGTMYYLQRNNNNVRYRNQTTNNFVASAEYGDSVSLSLNNQYYVYLTGTNWRNNTTNSNRVTILKRTAAASENHNITLTDYSSSTTSTAAAYYDTYPSYFPLTREKDENGEYTGAGKPDIKNTGYIVSGANLNDGSQQVPYGDVRVSRFEIKDISRSLSYAEDYSGSYSYTSSKLEVVTRTCVKNGSTYTDSDWTRISDDYNGGNTISNNLSSTFGSKLNYKSDLRFNKYKNSRSQLDATLSTGGGGIYGLHFMNASISTSNLITIPNALVLDGKTVNEEDEVVGTPYTDYQLPQDSIDFNLKDQGFINFFAGTYFTNNNTFFSLHTITRNASNQITSIQEIKGIYAPETGEPSAENPYVYSYSNSKPANSGDLVFDTSWITAPNVVDNCVYYFEIPVNAGEYALGSVSGKNGAYLMYLDIGAGIANYKDIVTTEHVVSTVKEGSFPKGVDFVDYTVGESWGTVTGGHSATVQVGAPANAGQTLNYDLDSATTTLTVSASGNSSPSLTTKFAERNYLVKKKVGDGAATNLDFAPPNLYTMTTDTVTLESYNVFTSSVTRTVTDTITITGGQSGTKIQLDTPLLSSGGFVVESAATFAVSSGPATVTASGLVTLTGSSQVVITMSYSESLENVEQWATASVAVTDDTEGTIFAGHFRDYDDPNIKVRYMYDGPNKIYSIYITAVNSTILDIDTLPPEGYTVKIYVNSSLLATLTSESSNSPLTITGSSGS